VQRLLEDFDAVFDLRYRIDGTALGNLVEASITRLEQHTLPDWGTPGPREEATSDPGRFVNFYYRPHLFPSMDIKLRLAHKLQFHLLPRELPADAPVSIAAVLESYCQLSGDLLGWEMLRNGKFLVWIVDMAGHGVRAGLASAMLKVLIDHVRERGRVDSLMGELNRTLSGCLRREHEGLFATAFFMALDRDGSAVYGSAAHPPVLVRRRNGDIEELGALDRPIGLFAETTYQSRELRLEPDDTVFLYTDGLVEATGQDGEAFGLDRLRGLVAREFGSPEELTRSIYINVADRQDLDYLDDDVTFLAAKV
jgi:sigma-B regulation protein RsbU (phosphoserine phosphatase)